MDRAGGITSRPMPSPGMTAILYGEVYVLDVAALVILSWGVLRGAALA